MRQDPRCISRESAQSKGGKTSIHPLYGVGEDIYRLITEINEWIRRHVALGSAAAVDESLTHSALQLDQRLRGWTLNDDCIFDKELRELSAAADALRWAAVMRLSQATRRNPVPEAPTTLEVDKILSAMSQIRPGSHVETQLVFPLFMAGASSPDKASRLTVEYRLNVIECTKGFGNIVCAHKLLDEVWARANERQAVHWEAVMHRQFPDLVLL
jgi:transcriptional activator protein UGA3